MRLDAVQQPFAFEAPSSGRTRAAKRASLSGAAHASRTWTARQRRYLAALITHGALTDQQTSERTGLPLSSINSVRWSLSDLVEPAGFDRTLWSDGRTTLRTRWQLRADARLEER